MLSRIPPLSARNMMSHDAEAPPWGGAHGVSPLYGNTRGAGVISSSQPEAPWAVPPSSSLSVGFGPDGARGGGAASSSGWRSWTLLQKGCAAFWMVFFWILIFAVLGLTAQTRCAVLCDSARCCETRAQFDAACALAPCSPRLSPAGLSSAVFTILKLKPPGRRRQC